MGNVSDPQRVITFLRKEENRNIFGENRSITGRWCPNAPRRGCVQLRQFFGRAALGHTLHYEIVADQRRGLSVEIHSETHTPKEVHSFFREQFEVQPRPPAGSYRFATIPITWQMRALDDIVKDIKIAVDTLYRKYDAYLNYVEGYYAGKGGIEGCKSYTDFLQDIT